MQNYEDLLHVWEKNEILKDCLGLVEEQKIREAQGEAEAIALVQKAYADSLTVLSQANISDEVLKLKTLEALQKVADGQATKLIIPSEIQNLAGLLASAKEVTK